MSKKQDHLFQDAIIVGVIPTFCLLLIELQSGVGRKDISFAMTMTVVMLPVAAVIHLVYRQLSQPSSTQSTEIDLNAFRESVQNEFKEVQSKAAEMLQNALKHAGEQRTETLQAFKQLSEIVGTLRKVLEERELELKRYKLNHDAELYRKFLRRIIDICESAQDAAAINPDKPEVAQIKELAEFLLEECDIKLFEPPLGGLYREEFGVADSPRYTPNDDPAKARRIARIIRPGYELIGGSTRQVVMPARVEVFDDVKTPPPSN